MSETPRPIRGSFGHLISSSRKARGWTLDDLVARSGVSRSTVIRWEVDGARNPTPDQVRAVCQALEIDPKRALLALGYLTAADLAPAA